MNFCCNGARVRPVYLAFIAKSNLALTLEYEST